MYVKARDSRNCWPVFVKGSETFKMTKIDIISGFLGAGKTTLIQKLLKEAFTKEQVVLIENEFWVYLLFVGWRFWKSA